jgi:hypothetical protein
VQTNILYRGPKALWKRMLKLMAYAEAFIAVSTVFGNNKIVSNRMNLEDWEGLQAVFNK